MFIPKDIFNYVARKELGDRSNRPVVVMPKNTRPPEFKGHSSGYETRTGIPIRHPSAYSKVGWSSMVYRHSTCHIQVGEYWCRSKVYQNYPQWIGEI